MRYIFRNNYILCNEISDRVVHHFVHCMETHGRHVQYLRFLQTIVKADGKYVKECQCKVMNEVGMTFDLKESLTGDFFFYRYFMYFWNIIKKVKITEKKC